MQRGLQGPRDHVLGGLGLLLLRAKLFDVLVAGLEVELHVAGLALLFAEGELEGPEFPGEVVHASLEESDVVGGGVVILLGGAEILIGTESLTKARLVWTHSLLSDPGETCPNRALWRID